jgi:hypothetical protein
LLGLAFSTAGCAASRPHADIPLTPPEQLCAGEQLASGAVCMPSAKLEHLLKDSELSLLQVGPTSGGTAGAMAMWLRFPKENITVKAKWKQAARGGQAMNNQPRKELAAYALQKLFLDPDEYVVPPTVSRCIPLDLYNIEVRPTRPTFPGTACAFGVLAYWIQGATTLDGYDKARFANDLLYRRAIVNLNIFTYLFDHRDTRPANFLVSKSDEAPRAFSIDNGLALGGLSNPREGVRHEWQEIVVPKISRLIVDRLRHITRADLDTLGTVAEFAIDGKQLEPIDNTDAFEEKEGIRRKGNVIQLGLTKSEIDHIEERLKKLLQWIDEGKLELY